MPGGYTLWGAWETCSVSCGVGTQRRTRTCTNPPPAGGGLICLQQNLGFDTDIRTCNAGACSAGILSFISFC